MDSTKAGGVIAYIQCSSASSSPESCHSDGSDCSQASSSPPPRLSPSQGHNVSAKTPVTVPRHAHGEVRVSRPAPSAKCATAELSGLVLLCKVCSDVASGFHYGVHACEGCKGFFRRSIQQNIRYKNCLRSESCPVTRANRNRCQQCRFKKCLTVGMSRDAVRFGRIPKREKQRMLLEMQTAMNSIMTSSPLHSQLHGNSSSPPVPMEKACDHPRGSPVPGALCPSPDSSGSPRSSDSGEDEVVGTVTKAHREDFMYNQEPLSACLKAPPSLSITGHMSTGEGDKKGQGNSHTHTTGCHLTCSDGHHAPCRDVLSRCPAQQLQSRPARQPVACADSSSYKGHQANECGGSGAVSRTTRRGGSRMHLVCPMGKSPFVDPCRSSHEVWEEFSMSFTPAVREVVEFAKRIPGFRDLSQQDQVCLLKAGTFEVLMVRFASLFDWRARTVTFLSGRTYGVDTLRDMGAGDLLESMLEFSERLAALGLSDEEMSLFTAVVLVSADRSGLENVNSVEALQEMLIRALRSLIMKNHSSEVGTFSKLLLRLPDLRSLNSLHSEELLAFKVHA